MGAGEETIWRADVLASRILVADDSDLQRSLLTHCLGRAGFTNIATAADGNEALSQYEAFRPDLVILDVAMPGLTGLEVCRALTARHQAAVPILIQSGLHMPDDRIRAFQAGATDFISKPIFPPELIARVQVLLDNRWMLHTLQRFRARLGRELGAARAMQETLLPSAADLQQARAALGLDIAARSEMSSEIGGDLWGLRRIGEQSMGLFIADFTGHGVASAVNAFRLHAMLGEAGIRYERPDLVMQALNLRFAGLLPAGTFATMFYGVIDLRRHRLEFAAAGAPPPLVLLPDGALITLDTSGLPIGIRSGQAYDTRSVAFPPGAALLLYSDALIETPDRDGHCWDSAELDAVLRRLDRHAPAEQGLAALCQAFDPRRTRPLPDDLTLVFLRRVIEVEAPF